MSSDTADEEPLDHRSGFYVGWRPEPRENPPRNVRPTALSIDVDLAQTNDVLIRVGSFEVFPEGFTFALAVNIRLSELHRLADFVCYPFHTKVFRPDRDMTLGLIWPDGRAIDSWHTGRADPDGAPADVALSVPSDGRWWVWPLPGESENPMTIWCSWPAAGIDRVEMDIAAGILANAGREARMLWPDDRASRDEVLADRRRRGLPL
jgi:hypothetical protein